MISQSPGGFPSSNLHVVLGGAAFLALLLAVCLRDVQVRRIPNRLVVALAVGGLASTTLAFGMHGLTRSLLCLAIGFAIWIPFYALRMLGAGDVKLFAAAAAWLSPAQVLNAALLAAFAGGLLSIIWLVRELGVGMVVMRLLHIASRGVLGGTVALPEVAKGGSAARRLPYGVAMATGLALAFFGVTLIQL